MTVFTTHFSSPERRVVASNWRHRSSSEPRSSASHYRIHPVRRESQRVSAGPDGNLWFTNYGNAKIGKITTSGAITEYSLPYESQPEQITAGPDGNLWFTDGGTAKIGRITTSGTITEYALPSGSRPGGITTGPEDNVWFVDIGSNKIGKITP